MAATRTLLIFSLMAGAASLSAQQSDVPADSTRVAQGKRLFEGKGLCFSCHGKSGEGLLGPSTKLVDRALIHTKATPADLIALIKSGIDESRSKSGHVMPPRGGSRLSDAEVSLVAAYVVELNGRGKYE